MSLRVYIPGDAGALAVGADAVAAALGQAARARGVIIDVVRTGSRGLYWLEPLVELLTPGGRIGFGPITAEEAPGVLAAMLGEISPGETSPGEASHPRHLGLIEEIPWLKRQTRLTFARCGIIDPLSLSNYRAHGGIRGLERALWLEPQEIIEAVIESGLRGRGGAGFPTGIKWRTVAQAQ